MGAAVKAKRGRRAFALAAAVGLALGVFFAARGHHARGGAAAAPTVAARTEKARVRERLAAVLGALAQASRVPTPDLPVTVDERIAERAKGDPVAAVVPSLTGMTQQAQLEALKAMQAWPGHKFLWQVPSLANARDLSFDERIELADQLGQDLIDGLEQQGVHYALPSGFTPVSSREPPDSPYGAPVGVRVDQR